MHLHDQEKTQCKYGINIMSIEHRFEIIRTMKVFTLKTPYKNVG